MRDRGVMQRERTARDDAELKFLLETICLSAWQRIPATISPVWIEWGQNQFCTDKPLRVILTCLEGAAIHAMNHRMFSSSTCELLAEIHAISAVANEYNDSGFFILPLQRRTAGEAFWRGLGRLCCLALQDQRFRCVEEVIGFDHFLQSYTSPATQEDINQFGTR